MQHLNLIMCLLVTIYLVEVTGISNANGILGGITDDDPSKPEYMDLAEESLNKYLKESGATRYYKVVHVTRATVQVVAGYRKNIDFYACPTNCVLYNGYLPTDTRYCQLSYPCNLMSCHSEIIEVNWENFKQITVSCNV